jgi:hypothetical protein
MLVFYIKGLKYEKVGTGRRSNGAWYHTIKLPYSKLKERTRYEEISDIDLEKLLNEKQWQENH